MLEFVQNEGIYSWATPQRTGAILRFVNLTRQLRPEMRHWAQKASTTLTGLLPPTHRVRFEAARQWMLTSA